MSDRALLGIVVVHFRDVHATLGCLGAIASDPSETPRLVVLVDNSGDFPPNQLPIETLLLPCPDNPGFGGGANRGASMLLEHAPVAGFVVLNHDVEVSPGFLSAAAEAILRPGVGSAGGPIFLSPHEGSLWAAGGHLRYFTGTVHQYSQISDLQRERRVGFLPGAAIVTSRDAWCQTGGFVASYFLYNEDIDLCLRLDRLGWLLWFHPAMACYHQLGLSTASRDSSPLYLEQLTSSRLRPFGSRTYRSYLAVLHSAWAFVRSLRLLLRFRSRARPRLGALWRGHGRALTTMSRQ